MRILAIMLALVPILGRPSTPAAPPAVSGSEEIWHMRLPEAIRIGLDNSEVVRCVRIGAQEIPLGDFEPNVGPSALDNVWDPDLPRGGEPAPR